MGVTSRPAPAPALAYVAPFAVFIVLRWLPVSPEWLAPLRVAAVVAALAVFSRRVLPSRLSFAGASMLIGVAVMIIWIAPDLLWPGYRQAWPFHNSLTGAAQSTLPVRLHSHAVFMAIRVFESAIVVPIIEELFWRGWLMRWAIRPDFESVPLGQYTAFSFWVVAVLFASEHGPYWDVGLIAAIAYNGWMVRTRSLAACMLAHGVTNALLAAYVLLYSQWQYWL